MSKKTDRTRNQTLATAYHEAGHVVVGYELGFRLGKSGVSIVPDGESLGQAYVLYGGWRPDRYSSKRILLRLERYTMVNFAGEEAQRKFNPRSVRKFHASGDLHDSVDNLLRFYDPKAVEARMEFLKSRTAEMVQSPTTWKNIVAVAEALHGSQHMHREEIEQVIRSVSRSNL